MCACVKRKCSGKHSKTNNLSHLLKKAGLALVAQSDESCTGDQKNACFQYRPGLATVFLGD